MSGVFRAGFGLAVRGQSVQPTRQLMRVAGPQLVQAGPMGRSALQFSDVGHMQRRYRSYEMQELSMDALHRFQALERVRARETLGDLASTLTVDDDAGSAAATFRLALATDPAILDRLGQMGTHEWVAEESLGPGGEADEAEAVTTTALALIDEGVPPSEGQKRALSQWLLGESPLEQAMRMAVSADWDRALADPLPRELVPYQEPHRALVPVDTPKVVSSEVLRQLVGNVVEPIVPFPVMAPRGGELALWRPAPVPAVIRGHSSLSVSPTLQPQEFADALLQRCLTSMRQVAAPDVQSVLNHATTATLLYAGMQWGVQLAGALNGIGDTLAAKDLLQALCRVDDAQIDAAVEKLKHGSKNEQRAATFIEYARKGESGAGMLAIGAGVALLLAAIGQSEDDGNKEGGKDGDSQAAEVAKATINLSGAVLNAVARNPVLRVAGWLMGKAASQSESPAIEPPPSKPPASGSPPQPSGDIETTLPVDDGTPTSAAAAPADGAAPSSQQASDESSDDGMELGAVVTPRGLFQTSLIARVLLADLVGLTDAQIGALAACGQQIQNGGIAPDAAGAALRQTAHGFGAIQQLNRLGDLAIRSLPRAHVAAGSMAHAIGASGHDVGAVKAALDALVADGARLAAGAGLVLARL